MLQKEESGADRLQAVLSSLSATVLLTVIGKISDFADENKLAAYLGLVSPQSRDRRSIKEWQKGKDRKHTPKKTSARGVSRGSGDGA